MRSGPTDAAVDNAAPACGAVRPAAARRRMAEIERPFYDPTRPRRLAGRPRRVPKCRGNLSTAAANHSNRTGFPVTPDRCALPRSRAAALTTGSRPISQILSAWDRGAGGLPRARRRFVPRASTSRTSSEDCSCSNPTSRTLPRLPVRPPKVDLAKFPTDDSDLPDPPGRRHPAGGGYNIGDGDFRRVASASSPSSSASWRCRHRGVPHHPESNRRRSGSGW